MTVPPPPTAAQKRQRPRQAVGLVTRGARISATVLHAVGSIAARGAWHRIYRPSRPGPVASGPIRLREMLEALGPTFTKLGQLVAGRPELLSGPYRTELRRLRDHVTPLAPGVALDVLVSAYARPLHQVFETFSAQPVAAGSIGQVHRATLPDGRAVAVKIRRPDAPRLIEADLRILTTAVRTVDRLVRKSRRLGLPALVDEFARALRGEVDYELEATHAAQIGAQLADLPWLTVPAMILALCAPDVLVMDFVDGVPLTDNRRLLGFDRHRLGTEVIAVNLQLILFNDVFHADPHPGNYLVTPDGRLAMLDYGQIGHSSVATRNNLLHLLTALITGDITGTANAVRAICGASLDDTPDLGLAVSDLFTGISTKPLGEVRIGAVFHRLLAVLDQHHLSMPAEMTMLIKAVIESEATAEELHPGLQLTEIIPLVINRQHPPPTARPTSSAATAIQTAALRPVPRVA